MSKTKDPDYHAVSEGGNRYRRKKEELGTRYFKCGGCPKNYASYPALFTHIKNKHGGIEPPGTIRLRQSRGRPKINSETLQYIQKLRDVKPKAKLPTEQNFQPGFFDSLHKLRFIKEPSSKQSEEQDSESNSFILEKGEEYDCIKEFPVEFFQSSEFYEAIIKNMKIVKLQYGQSANVFNNESYDREKAIRNVKFNRICTIFLFFLSQDIHVLLYREFCILIAYFRQAFNEKSKTQDESEFKNGQDVATFSNVFMQKYHQMIIERSLEIEYTLQFLGCFQQGKVDKIGQKNVARIVEMLCNWNYFQFFSNRKVKIQ